jgi:hypothetical protein
MRRSNTNVTQKDRQKRRKKEGKIGCFISCFAGRARLRKGKCWREGTFVRVCIYALRTMRELMLSTHVVF